MVIKFISLTRILRAVPLLAIVLACCFGLAATARATSTINVASDPAQGNPFEVQPSQTSTLTYSLTYSVGKNSEGVKPSINSITVTFTAEKGSLLSNGKTTEMETLTQGLTSPMTVSCQASGSQDGDYPVTCRAILNLSDGTTATGNTAGDVFDVSQMTVNVTGDPYVIIGMTTDPLGSSEPAVLSQYNASVAGGNTPYHYQWNTTSNIVLEFSAFGGPDSSNPQAYGVSPAGAGVITCVVTSDGTEPSQSGSLNVTVAPEFSYNWNKLSTLVIDAGATNGVYTQQSGGTGGTTLKYTKTVGTNVKGALDLTAPISDAEDAAGSLGLTLGFDYNSSSDVSQSVKALAGTTEWVAIGPLENATSGQLTVTKPSGPQKPQAVYKYTPASNGAAVLARSSFQPYQDTTQKWLFIDPNSK